MTDELPIPQRIAGRYRVEALLGRGSTSCVLRVFDEHTSQHVALKQAQRPQDALEARAFASFRQEYHVLSQIVHPNVITACEYGSDEQQPFYTMELIEGRSVHELAPLPWRRVCEVLLDLCSPLSLLHARRFLHGNVTAHNVLITHEGITKLIDWCSERSTSCATRGSCAAPPTVTRSNLTTARGAPWRSSRRRKCACGTRAWPRCTKRVAIPDVCSVHCIPTTRARASAPTRSCSSSTGSCAAQTTPTSSSAARRSGSSCIVARLQRLSALAQRHSIPPRAHGPGADRSESVHTELDRLSRGEKAR